MSSYPVMLTPPSSNEDSPPLYSVVSPTSSSFQDHIEYNSQMTHHVYITPSDMEVEHHHHKAGLKFIEQPTDRFRFRYKSEMAGTHGSLTGMNSDKSRKQTYPTVELVNFTGRAIVRCSIYQINAKDRELMPHAHRLIMKKGKDEQDDPHDMPIGPEQGYKACFHGMGIIHTAKKNIVGELVKKKTHLKKEEIARLEGKIRELNTKEIVEIKGLAETESKSINLNIVCLRFDAFVQQDGILYPLCEPIFSHGINNLKSALTGDLKIVRLDHVVCEAKGGKEIYLLVERVTKRNIKIRFYELDDQDQVIWEDWGQFNDLDVHHQYAIVFRTPRYRDQNITKTVKVFMELFRPSDEARSEPREFRYIPNQDIKTGVKRRRYDYSSSYSISDNDSYELPLTINSTVNTNQQNRDQIQADPFGSGNLNLVIPENLSDELQRALRDFGSTEFQNLFNNNKEAINDLFALDAPQNDTRYQFPTRFSKQHIRQQMVSDSINQALKLEVNIEDRRKAAKFMEELRCFVKANKSNLARAQGFLSNYLGEDKATNPLHVLISLNRVNEVTEILRILMQFKKLDLLKIRNDDEQTPLHLAVICHHPYLVALLLKLSAPVGAVDSESNTVLHVAIKENVGLNIMERLLEDRAWEKVDNYIDLKNNDGNTALFLAIEKKDLSVVQLLCSKGANVNAVHPKDGFVPVRSAIEKQHVEIIEFLLSLPNISITTEDFASVTPLGAALQSSAVKAVSEMFQKYVKDHQICVEVKQEESDTEDEAEDEVDVKPEPMAVDDLEELYKNVKTFTLKYLDDLSKILDTRNTWGSLVQLLGFEHLVSSGIIHDNSMSRAVLKYATETSDVSLWDIRTLLDNLDETKAVQMMDRMVQEISFS